MLPPRCLSASLRRRVMLRTYPQQLGLAHEFTTRRRAGGQHTRKLILSLRNPRGRFLPTRLIVLLLALFQLPFDAFYRYRVVCRGGILFDAGLDGEPVLTLTTYDDLVGV